MSNEQAKATKCTCLGEMYVNGLRVAGTVCDRCKAARQPAAEHAQRAEPVPDGCDWMWCYENPKDAARLIDELEARAALQQQAGAWLPIETAPKDGARILLGEPDNEDTDRAAVSTMGWWTEAEEDGPDCMGADAGFVDVFFNIYSPGRSFGAPAYQGKGSQPTHWMPLPAAPTLGGAK